MNRRRFSRLTRCSLALATLAVPQAGADVLQWDGNAATAPNPAGGAGTWDASNSNWFNALTLANQSYGSGSTPHDAVFGTSGGAVSVSGTVNAKSLTFNTTGYTLSSGIINLTSGQTIAVTNPTDSATISSAISSAAQLLTKTGAGTLTLSSVSNTFANLTIDQGTLAFSNDERQLGGPGTSSLVTVTLDGGTLQKTGSTNVTSGFFRNYVVGPAGGVIDIAALGTGNNTGLTIGGSLQGTGALRKVGVGTMRLDRTISTFVGGLGIENGIVRFNNNNDAGPEALRMNRISFGTGASTAGQLQISGSGSSTDGSASELRTGEWNSASAGAGLVMAATTISGSNGHDLLITALADGTFSGTVNNRANAFNNSNPLTEGNIAVRGIATQTFTGTTNINNTISISQNAGMTLASTATMTGANVNLNLLGGTFTLENATTNNADRYRDGGSIEPRGGGRLVLSGNATGSSETMGKIQLGTDDGITQLKDRSGQLSIDVIHRAGVSSSTVLTFDSLQRDAGRTTVDFSAHDAGNATLALGQPGAAPRILFTSAPSLDASGQFESSTFLPGDVGWATVSQSSFATYTANGVAAVTTTPFASATTNDHASITANTTLAGASNKTVSTLTVAPSSANQTLDLTGSANLVTHAILLAGNDDYEIRNTAGGTGGIAPTGHLYVHTPQSTLKLNVGLSGSGALVKSGAGVLVLAGANSSTGPTAINAGTLRAASSNLASGPIEFRGGVLELTGGGVFNRTVGLASGQINWNDSTSADHNEDRGGGGFSAFGADVTVYLNTPGSADNFLWEGGAGFIESGYALTFGSAQANARVTFADNIKLNSIPKKYNAREIRVIDNPNSTTDAARITGVISSEDTTVTPDLGVIAGVLADVLKTGNGTLELAAANTYYGGTIVAEGTLLLADNHALGADTSAPGALTQSGPYVLVGNRGGAASAALLTSAAVNINREITIQAGSTGTVTLGSATSAASTFSGSIIVNRDLQLTAPTGGVVTLSGTINNVSASTITKIGDGTARVRNLRNGSLAVNEGTLQILQDGTGAGTSKLANVSVTAGATLDLTDNKLIVTSGTLGTWNGSDYTGLTGLIKSGRITTSQTAASSVANLTTLAIATASEVSKTSLGGLSAAPTDVLIMYTYAGDANLTGSITGDDYFRIDAGYTGHLTGYSNGDFNYDGKINADDYFLIDRNYSRQSSAFAASLPAGVSAVPEPGVMTLVAGASLFGLKRRRRNT